MGRQSRREESANQEGLQPPRNSESRFHVHLRTRTGLLQSVNPSSPLSPVEAHDKQQRGTLRQVSFNLDTFISCWILSWETNFGSKDGELRTERNHNRVCFGSRIFPTTSRFQSCSWSSRGAGLGRGGPALRCTECILTDRMCFGSVPRHRKSTWS